MSRLIGTETEYGIWADGLDPHDMIEVSREIVRRFQGPAITSWNYGFEVPRRDLRGFTAKELRRDPDDAAFDATGPKYASLAEEHADHVLANGARLYNDHAHPEYSTPECTRLADLVAHDKAGERIVLECARTFGAEKNIEVAVYKNNTDFHGASYGAHESLLLSRDVPADDLIAILAPFLATRQVFAGAGKVGSDRKPSSGDIYQISQRAEFVDVLASVDTLHQRPLVNTRDEPHASEDRYRRLHVIVGDANMSEWATAMKIGTLALVLDLAESGWRAPLELADPVGAVRAIALDPTLRARVSVRRRAGGASIQSEMTATEIQRVYLRAAESAPSALPDRDWVLASWNRVLDDLERAPERAADRVDWVAKLRLLGDYRRAMGPEVSCAALQSIDLAYHDIRPERGLYHLLSDSGSTQRVVTDRAIERAMLEAPRATRAFVRGHFVMRHSESVSAIGWNGIAFRHGDEEMVFDMNSLVDGTLGRLNDELRKATTLDQTAAVLRRYRGRSGAAAPKGSEV